MNQSWLNLPKRSLAKGLKNQHRFREARNVLARVRNETVDSELKLKLAQVHALCIYKDPDLPADAKLDRALSLLQEADNLTETTDQETLGLAGAIFKNKWEADANPQHLERALAYYLRGSRLDPSRTGGIRGSMRRLFLISSPILMRRRPWQLDHSHWAPTNGGIKRRRSEKSWFESCPHFLSNPTSNGWRPNGGS
jgi:hypothetical protein